MPSHCRRNFRSSSRCRSAATWACAPALQTPQELVVNTATLYEVFKVVLRESSESAGLQAVAAMQKGTVVDLIPKLALAASKLNLLHALPISDAQKSSMNASLPCLLWPPSFGKNRFAVRARRQRSGQSVEGPRLRRSGPVHQDQRLPAVRRLPSRVKHGGHLGVTGLAFMFLGENAADQIVDRGGLTGESGRRKHLAVEQELAPSVVSGKSGFSRFNRCSSTR